MRLHRSACVFAALGSLVLASCAKPDPEPVYAAEASALKSCASGDVCGSAPYDTMSSAADASVSVSATGPLYATCETVAGVLHCVPKCPEGYTGTPPDCVPPPNPCAVDNGGCDPLTTCVVHNWEKFCSPCPAGYSGTGETGCVDIDECALLYCPGHRVCTNTPGSYSCGDCMPGTTLITQYGKTLCADIDECANGTAGCNLNAKCTNLIPRIDAPARFSCTCKSGYVGDGFTCTNVNECATDNGGCIAPSICVDTPGSYECRCAAGSGLVPIGKTCCPPGYGVRHGECVAPTIQYCHPFDPLCDRTTRRCPPGFWSDEVNCYDLNECLIDNGGCAAGQTCKNYDGGRTCDGTCPPGFEDQGDKCVDIDECGYTGSGLRCINTPGSYREECNPGWVETAESASSGVCEPDYDFCERVLPAARSSSRGRYARRDRDSIRRWAPASRPQIARSPA